MLRCGYHSHIEQKEALRLKCTTGLNDDELDEWVPRVASGSSQGFLAQLR